MIYILIIYIYSPGTALRAVPILECAAVLVRVHLYWKTGHAVTTRFLVSYDSMSSCDSVGPYLELQAMLFSQVQPISNWRQSISRWVDRSISRSTCQWLERCLDRLAESAVHPAGAFDHLTSVNYVKMMHKSRQENQKNGILLISNIVYARYESTG